MKFLQNTNVNNTNGDEDIYYCTLPYKLHNKIVTKNEYFCLRSLSPSPMTNTATTTSSTHCPKI